MKSKKMLLVLVFAAIMAAGWLAVVRAVSNTEALEEIGRASCRERV